MGSDDQETRMVFRTYPDGSVIALMPDDPGTDDPTTCNAYMHIGQHGSADPAMVVLCTNPATPAEAGALAAELTRIGYKVKIMRRIDHRSFSRRKAALQRS